MLNSPQGKRIAVAALSVFVASISALLFFVDLQDGKGGHANVLEATHHAPEGDADKHQQEDPMLEYREIAGFDVGPIFTIDLSGKFLNESADFCELLGKDCEELAERTLYEFINLEDLPALVASHGEIFEKKERIEADGPFRMAGGEGEILVILNLHPILDSDDHIVEIIVGVKDITEKVKELNMKGPELKGEGNAAWVKELYPQKLVYQASD